MGNAKEEWEKVKQALKRPPTEQARKEAAGAFQEYEDKKNGKRSDPVLVSLGFRKGYPTAVRVTSIPKELEKNPDFFEHLKEVIVGEE